jgi:hypothetical protein
VGTDALAGIQCVAYQLIQTIPNAWSVLVVVPVMCGVPTPLVDVVDMIVVRHRDVATALAVDMIVALVHRVTGLLTFVVMRVMLPVEMAVM